MGLSKVHMRCLIMVFPLLAAACGPGAAPAALSGELDPSTLPAAPAVLGLAGDPAPPPPRPEPPKPLAVIHRAPTGQAPAPSAILVTFNQPMARLGSAERVEAAGAPFVLSPPAQGNFRWVAGDTAKLSFKAPLASATRYRVTVPAGVRALAGVRLARAESWTFETRRPRLLGVDLLPGEKERYGQLLPGDTFVLRFNQRVSPTGLSGRLSLKVNGVAVGYRILPLRRITRQMKLRPVRPFPPGARVVLTVHKGVRGEEGPLLSDEETTRKFEVYGPLTAEVQCDCEEARPGRKCWPMHNQHHLGLVLSFSEPVCRSELVKRLKITPRPRAKLEKLLRSTEDWLDEEQEYGPEDPCSHAFVFTRDLRLHQRYEVRISGQLTDVFGQRLGKDVAAAFTTRGLPPGIFLPKEGHGVREPWHPYRLKSVNVKTLQLSATPIRGKELVAYLACKRHRKREDCNPGSAAPMLKTVKVGGKQDAIRDHTMPLPGALALVRASSPELLDDEGKRVEYTRLVTRATMGLHARLTAYGVLAWATSLGNARGVAGAEIEVMDEQGRSLASGHTDAHGLLALSSAKLAPLLGKERPPRVHVFARKAGEEVHLEVDGNSNGGGNSWWYHNNEDGEGPLHMDMALYSDWQGDRPVQVGHVSTERGIYRPGEKVYVQGAARRYRAWRVEAMKGAEAQLQLRGRGGQELARSTVKLSPLGAFTGSFDLPDKGRLGTFSVVLQMQGRTLASRSFRVAQYREPRFAVHLTAPGEVMADRPFSPIFAARYLFGGAMAGAAYRLSVEHRPNQFWVPGFADYLAGADSWTLGETSRRWHLSSGVLGSGGQASPALTPPRLPGGGLDPWPRLHQVEVEVTSASRRSAASRTSTEQRPGLMYVARKKLPTRGKKSRRRVRIFHAGMPGSQEDHQPRGGVITAAIFRWRGSNTPPDWTRALWKRRLQVSRGGALLEIPWRALWDQWDGVVLVLSVRDGQGREARTAEVLNRPTREDARWEQEQERLTRDRERQLASLTITTDRERYLPGQSAKITVRRRGLAGDAVLLVERERVFRAIPLRFNGAGRALARLRVEPAFAGQVTLRALALRKGRQIRGRLGPLAVATHPLEVDNRPDRLQVAIHHERSLYKPGQQVKLSFNVRNKLGEPRRARLVVMAVDEAVLRLTRFTLPDPFRDLAHTPRDGVLAEELRQHLLPLSIPVEHIDLADATGCSFGSMGALGHGGGGGGMGYGRGVGRMGSGRRKKKEPRRRFITTAWHATLITDDQGQATASFTLPGNLTTFRLMAMAVGEGRAAGSGEASLRVDLPLLALPALPRFMRPGDRASVGVVLYNNAAKLHPAVSGEALHALSTSETPSNSGLAPGTARVSAKISGSAIKLRGPASQEVKLPRGASREVRFPLTAADVGQAKINFTVSMGGVHDALEQPLEVTRAVAPMAASVSGQTQGAVRQGLARLGDLLPSVGGLEVRLASTALTGVEDGLDQLVRYPYGCLEQQSSRVLALTAATALGDRFKLDLKREPASMIRAGLRNLLAMQHAGGGFGYWPGSTRTVPWLTAYALVVLHRIQLVQPATKVAVPADPVRKALRYLRPYARAEKTLDRYAFARRAMILYALRLHGEEVGDLAAGLGRQRKRQPLFARAMLLAALAGRTRETAAHRKLQAALVSELSNSLRVDGTHAHAEEALHDGYKVLMHSNDRTSAMVLLALLAAQPEHPMVPRLVRWFLSGRKEARFRNTQEAAWALLAFWDYARLREKETPDFQAGVWLGRKRLVTARFKGHTTAESRARIKMADLLRLAGTAAKDLVIARQGKGTLYYVARLRYAPIELPRLPRDHGFKVRRQVVLLDAGGAPVTSRRPPKLGETVLVTLTVWSNEARRYVVVEDPLPAGLEALDTTLATGSRSFGAWKQWSGVSRHDHRELRDDRVLFFRDLMQPGTLTYRYLARVTSPGSFVAPPARAEEMYTPEVYGHTGAARVSYAP